MRSPQDLAQREAVQNVTYLFPSFLIIFDRCSISITGEITEQSSAIVSSLAKPCSITLADRGLKFIVSFAARSPSFNIERNV